ncbi:MAG TPA: phosphotransferase [Roseiflexaceae bacterium]|nr:phosphotransferase [Roseiflexaceae bacterium]
MLTSSDIARVLAHYDLGVAEGAIAFGHGFVNETAIVTTSRGRFVVRRNHRRIGFPTHRYRHALTAWARAHGAPTAAILPARNGDTLVVLDGRAYEVQEYIEGCDFDPSCPLQVAAAGAALARFHLAAEGFAPPPAPTEPRYAPRALHGLVERLLERDVMGELHEDLAWYDARAALLRTLLPDAAYAALRHLLIHGDVHPDNFRFAGDQVAGLLDLDQVAWDARVVDLADALVAFCSAARPKEPQGWGVFRGPLDEGRAVALLAAYASLAPLTPAEAAALPVAVEVLWLRGALGRVVSTPEGAPEYHLEVLEQGRRLSGWIATRREALTARWNACATGGSGKACPR